MDTDKLKAMLEEADEAWTKEEQPPPFSLYVAKRFYLAGLEAARGKVDEEESRALGGGSYYHAEVCAKVSADISQLITEARQ